MKNRELREVVGINVKYYRFLMGFTQEKLAEEVEVSSRYISNIENGQGNLPIDKIQNISNALNIEPYLLFREEKLPSLPKRVNIR